MVQFILSENYLSKELYLHLQGKKFNSSREWTSPFTMGLWGSTCRRPLLSASGQALNSLGRLQTQRGEVWGDAKPPDSHNPSSKILIIKPFLSVCLTLKTHVFSRHPTAQDKTPSTTKRPVLLIRDSSGRVRARLVQEVLYKLWKQQIMLMVTIVTYSLQACETSSPYWDDIFTTLTHKIFMCWQSCLGGPDC